MTTRLFSPTGDPTITTTANARWLYCVEQTMPRLDDVRAELRAALDEGDVDVVLAACLRMISLGLVLREEFYKGQAA